MFLINKEILNNIVILIIITVIINPFNALIKADDLSEYEKYKQEKNRDKDSWKQERDSELENYKERVQKERKAWQEYVNDVRSKWGEYVDSKPKTWAEYGKDKNSLSVIDYENNLASLEVIIEGDDDSKAEKLFSKRFEDVMNTKDKDRPALEKQFKNSDGKWVNKNNSKRYINNRFKNKKYKKEVIVGGDGRVRTKYKVSLDMVPNSMKIRAEKYMSLVRKYSKLYNVDPALVLALIHTESAFNPRAFSRRPDGTPMACGLMQIIPSQAGRDAHKALYGSDKIVKPEFLYNPENNIKMGVWYVKWLKKWWAKRDKKYGNSSSSTQNDYYTISSYNQGMGTILKKAYKKHNLSNKSDQETYQILNSERSISKEGRDYIERVVKRRKLYSEN